MAKTVNKPGSETSAGAEVHDLPTPSLGLAGFVGAGLDFITNLQVGQVSAENNVRHQNLLQNAVFENNEEDITHSVLDAHVSQPQKNSAIAMSPLP